MLFFQYILLLAHSPFKTILKDHVCLLLALWCTCTDPVLQFDFTNIWANDNGFIQLQQKCIVWYGNACNISLIALVNDLGENKQKNG